MSESACLGGSVCFYFSVGMAHGVSVGLKGGEVMIPCLYAYDKRCSKVCSRTRGRLIDRCIISRV